MKGNFLMQAVRDLFLVNREGLVDDVMASGHQVIEFSFLVSKLATLDFQRADYGLFRWLFNRAP